MVAITQCIGPVDALDAFHDQNGPALAIAPHRVDGHDVRVLQPAHREAFDDERLVRARFVHFALQGLDRHIAAERALMREQHEARFVTNRSSVLGVGSPDG